MTQNDSYLTPKIFSPQERRDQLLAKITWLRQEIATVKAKNTAATSASTLPPSFLLPYDSITHLQRFIDSNILPVMRASLNGGIIEVNEAFARLLGYSKEELGPGKIGWRELTPVEWADSDDKALAAVFAGKKVVPYEKEYFRKDHTRVPVILAVSTPDNGGDDCLIFVYDLTERKQAEANLKASESQFRLLAEVIPQIVWITNDAGYTSYCNQRFYETTGLNRENENGLLWMEAIHEEDREHFLEEAKISKKAKAPFELKVRYRLKNGEYHWYLFRAMPMNDIETSESRWFGTCTDIDDQIQFEESLRQSEAKFRTLADAIPQIVLSVSSAGEITFFNHRWFEYTGLTLEQSQNNGWQLLIHPLDLPEFTSRWSRALMTGETYEMEFRLKPAMGTKSSKDSSYRWHLARAVALRDPEGRISKWFATWTEIESQKGVGNK